MKATGINISTDWDGSMRMTLTIAEDSKAIAADIMHQFREEPVMDVAITKPRKKRSLEANAYLWVLVTEIAAKIRASKEEVYEQMIQRYAPPKWDDKNDRPITLTVKAEVDMGCIDGHYKLIRTDGNWAAYMALKGSSEMESREMSVLIDGVVSECKDLGIETMTPAELAGLVENWGQKHG